MAQVADQIAVAIGKQWADEAAVRRLNDPYPLPVSWDADTSLTDSWDSLVKLAGSGAGWPLPPPAGTWAPGPDDLAGKDGELVEVLTRVPTGRLVVLGEPGAGKTMLMVRPVLDLLARRAAGGPVPFLTSIASWNPVKQGLRDWLGAQLLIDHPALGISPADRAEPTHAAALLASGLILPVLDGLDEIPEQVRGRAIGRINDALRPGEQVVVTSRIRQYRDAVRPQEVAR
jgi:predicted NACHT family NTPase